MHPPHLPLEQCGRFENLVSDLSNALGCSGLDSADVDPNHLLELMRNYPSDCQEWQKFITKTPKKGERYTRNLVNKGNGKYNLLLLVWAPGEGSLIHDHTKHCCMKVLQGNLHETVYALPDSNRVDCGLASPLQPKREAMYLENQVSYISNSIGLHSIFNPDKEQFAVSLHLYTPPVEACHIFDEDTGKSTECKLGCSL